MKEMMRLIIIIFLGVVALAFGLIKIYKPSFGWRGNEAWKYEADGEVEPSEAYLVLAQIGGIFATVLGAFLILVGILRMFY